MPRPREFTVARLAPPEWLVRSLGTLKPQPAPIPWPAVARAAVAMALPLAVGLAAGYPAYGALASMGALSGVIGDTATAYRMRVYNIAVPQLFGAVGIMLGTLVYGHGWVAVGVVTAIALISGMISTVGAVASVSGLLLLLNSVIGAGLPMPGDDWWLPPLLMTSGGLLVLTLALLAWPVRSGVPERATVAGAYRTVADLLEKAGAADAEAYAAARQDVTHALNQAYDVVLARRALYHARNQDLVRLLAQLNAVIPIVEAAPAAYERGRPLPPEVPGAVRSLADAVERGFAGPVELRLPEGPQGPAAHAVDAAVRYAAEALAESDPGNVDDRLGRPAALRDRVRRAARNVLLSAASWRYGLRLALCIGLAQSLVSLVDVPRSYWVALTITFVMKPDFGSVFSRAVLRAVGTAAGLVLAAAVLSQVPRGWWDVPVMVLLAPLIPALTPRGYGYQTAAITPVILLLSDVLNRQGAALIAPRMYDSLMGCGIALVAGYLLWPESWGTRIGDRLADAVADTARYVECAFLDPATPGVPDPAARARMRRRIYRDLSVVRTEFQRALTEPPPFGTRAAAFWPLVVALERVVDATTSARVRVRHGAPRPAPAESKELSLQLEQLAEDLREDAALRRAGGSGPRPHEPLDDEDGTLGPLRREIAAARAVAGPGGSAPT
ncbi:FUSC family protein [Streptomyces luteolus]|uniref:FUSC family protein n=1 Tax=Streptomyces luteolus TaxID=3043615 RepID=A0ABT6T1H0_9ACTN|nr:FUSC family protein [Streptomyces sp. B-S-A12]MDI3420939.1 FUSC family protein [Streptomyces sp. B-S-A12]